MCVYNFSQLFSNSTVCLCTTPPLITMFVRATTIKRKLQKMHFPHPFRIKSALSLSGTIYIHFPHCTNIEGARARTKQMHRGARQQIARHSCVRALCLCAAVFASHSPPPCGCAREHKPHVRATRDPRGEEGAASKCFGSDWQTHSGQHHHQHPMACLRARHRCDAALPHCGEMRVRESAASDGPPAMRPCRRSRCVVR